MFFTLDNGYQHHAEEEKENKLQGFASWILSSEPGKLDQIYVNKS
jgi:hypothetical protein